MVSGIKKLAHEETSGFQIEREAGYSDRQYCMTSELAQTSPKAVHGDGSHVDIYVKYVVSVQAREVARM